MPEKIRFLSPKEKREQEVAETLKKEGGIFYREGVDSETGKKKRLVNILGVEVETRASPEDIEVIKKEIVLSEVDQRILRTIAESYALRQPLMLEGDPGIGKTFLVKKFIQLIYGKEAPILELVGTPRTSELEILGHWAPKGLKEKEAEEYKELLKKSFMEAGAGRNLNHEFNQRLSGLNQRFLAGGISQEQFQEEFGELTTKYINNFRLAIAETAMAKFIRPETEWEFKEGALLQAYSGMSGRGYILLVDEFNLIPSNYQQIFLQIGGEKGALSESISFWGDNGRTRYQRGQDTWICFASNYPEKTPGRSEVVAPMTDRLIWRTITSEETEKKKELLRKTAAGRLTKRQKKLTQLVPEVVSVPVEKGLIWDKVLNEQLGEQIADIVDIFDKEFNKYYEGVDDTITIKGEKRRRNQQFELSTRNPLRLYSYLDHFQVRDPKTRLIDFTKTLYNGFESYYFSRLADPEARKKMQSLFNEIMTGDTGKIKFEKKVMARKEILDILVQRVPVSPKELEERRREEERMRVQLGRDIQDFLK